MLWLAAALAGSAAAPLAPSGQWAVFYEPNTCILQRDFGTGANKVTFAIRPWPIPKSYEVALAASDLSGPFPRESTARLTIHPSNESTQEDATVYRLTGGKQQVALFDVEEKWVAALRASSTIEIQAGGKTATIAPTGTSKALAALDTCQDALLNSWGVTREAVARIATEPKGKGAPQWITNADYPSAALRTHAQGTTVLLWTIGTNGHVRDCRILRSSGHKMLDDAACEALTKRGRYSPALDKNGKPVEAWSSRRVRWIYTG